MTTLSDHVDQPMHKASGPIGSDADGAAPGLVSPWFDPSEYHDRLARLQDEIRAHRLDAIVLFQPESVTWLTGFFTRGYGSFNFVIVPRQGEPRAFFRNVEEYYFARTSVFREREHWTDGQDPVEVGAALVARSLPNPARLGLELGAWPLNAARHAALRGAIGSVEVVDCSPLTAALRRTKSPAEVAMMRRAARAAEAATAALVAAAAPGVSERDLAACASAAMVRAGSDLPGPGVLSSGPGALHLHGSFTDRVLAAGDTIQYEPIACVRHYHARFMRPIKVAPATSAEQDRAAMLAAIQDEALATVAPGVRACVPDRLYRARLAETGLAPHYPMKTFYGVGLLLPPSGGEGPEATPDAAWTFAEGMTFHSYLIVEGFGMSETIAVTADGIERLTRFPRRLLMGGEVLAS
jgi:Xaa-Pro dipeptidase